MSKALLIFACAFCFCNLGRRRCLMNSAPGREADCFMEGASSVSSCCSWTTEDSFVTDFSSLLRLSVPQETEPPQAIPLGCESRRPETSPYLLFLFNLLPNFRYIHLVAYIFKKLNQYLFFNSITFLYQVKQ